MSAATGQPAGFPRLAAVCVLRDGMWVDVRRREPDGEYVATCKVYPGLSWLAPTPEEAEAELRRAIAEVREDVARDTPGAAAVRVPASAGASSSPAPGLGDALRRGFSAFTSRYDRALASRAGAASRRRSGYDDLVTSWEEATAGEREAFLTYLDMEAP